MRYRNVKTGAEFESDCVVAGRNWVKLGSSPTESEDKTVQKTEAKPVRRKKVTKK